jgi:spiro-SPASM protein
MSEAAERKNVAILYADMERSALGLRSRFAEEIGGKTLLLRTVERLQQAEQLSEIIVFCPEKQSGLIQQLVDGTRAIIIGLREEVPTSPYVRRRKWGLNCWRGGIREATVFDEQSFTAEMVLRLREREVYTTVAVPPEAILVDPQLIDGLVAHHHENGSAMRFTFTQAAPGLAGCAYRLDLLHELVQTNATIGNLLYYDPESPHMDYIMQECNFRVAKELCVSPYRYLADTARSFDHLTRLAASLNGQLESGAAGQFVERMQTQLWELDALPRELEIEINTEPSLRIQGYPHGRQKAKGKRQNENNGKMSFDLFEKIVSDCASLDDICITIGGFGEPLKHPELMQMIAAAKQAGILGINIETDGLALQGELAEALAESAAEVISVYVDANSRELYEQVKGQNRFEQVERNLETFGDKVADNGPMVIPHLVKTRETMAQMEEFYERWIRRCGAAVIVGYNDYAGQIENKAVMDMSPPQRYPCSRLYRTLNILADGNVTICAQDFTGQHIIGNVKEISISELWQSQKMNQLRLAHQEGIFDSNALCAKCKEWHR